MEKNNTNKPIKYRDLPPHLKQKYKNSVLFENKNSLKAKKFSFDLNKLKEKKASKEKTIEEKLGEFTINKTEEKYLLNVFKNLSSSNSHKYFTSDDIADVFVRMNIKMTKNDIDLMIWEFDENLNKKITEKQFIQMYKKCTIDRVGAEPKSLFHLTQFLMFCRPNYYKISVEDTLQLLYVRAKKQAQEKKTDERILLEQQIKVIFGENQKTPDGVEKEIGFKQYLEKINRRAIQKRQQEILKERAQFKYGVNI